MTKFLFACAFAVGAIAILWIGNIFLGADSLGLGVTVLIGVVYAVGAWELLRFRRDSANLQSALITLTTPLDDLNQWLQGLNLNLQNAVRLRIEGVRNGLPAPVLTPYLVSLLVMLGLLGTFVGMVDTLRGAVFALEGTSELEAIRAGLAAPIEGLGLAFGTSVAGVAASAMLGLLSTISRRERLQVSHLLDTKIGSELRNFSANHQQQLAFQALRDQALSLPVVVEQLGKLANSLEKMGERVGDRLLENQNQFQNTVSALYSELNQAVDQSLKASLVESAELISASVQPLTEKTLTQLSASAAATHQQLINMSEQQLTALGEAAQTNTALVQEAVDAGLSQQRESTQALLSNVNDAMASAAGELQGSSQLLLDSFGETTERWVNQHSKQAEQFSTTLAEELTRLRDDESQRGSAALERLNQLEASVATHLGSLGHALEEPMTRLIETASQTPKAAADVIEKLRNEMTKNLQRDNELLSERTNLMAQLDTLSNSLQESSNAQRDAIDSLIERSANTLSDVGSTFGEHLEVESSKLADVAAHVEGSSIEMASMSDAFSVAVTQFSESNNQLIENLTRIEASLEQSNKRSNEQLGYYVSQAREVIDHNLLSHKEIIDALRTHRPSQPVIEEVG